MSERGIPLPARERAFFEAATQGRPEEFVRLCKIIGRDPQQVLDGYDAEPGRWLIVSFSTSGIVSDSIRELQFPTRIRAHLDAAGAYVERPWGGGCATSCAPSAVVRRRPCHRSRAGTPECVRVEDELEGLVA